MSAPLFLGVLTLATRLPHVLGTAVVLGVGLRWVLVGKRRGWWLLAAAGFHLANMVLTSLIAVAATTVPQSQASGAVDVLHVSSLASGLMTAVPWALLLIGVLGGAPSGLHDDLLDDDLTD